MFDFTLTTEALGVVVAVIAGLLSLVPALGATDLRRNITALVVLILASFMWGGYHYVSVAQTVMFLLNAGVYAVITYKLVLQNFVVNPAQRALARNSDSYRVSMSRHS